MRRVLDAMAPLFRHYAKREAAPRRVCPACQFETGELDTSESHAPGCAALDAPNTEEKG